MIGNPEIFLNDINLHLHCESATRYANIYVDTDSHILVIGTLLPLYLKKLFFSLNSHDIVEILKHPCNFFCFHVLMFKSGCLVDFVWLEIPPNVLFISNY